MAKTTMSDESTSPLPTLEESYFHLKLDVWENALFARIQAAATETPAEACHFADLILQEWVARFPFSPKGSAEGDDLPKAFTPNDAP